MEIPRDNQEWFNYIETLKNKLPQTYPEYHRPLPPTIHRAIDHTLLKEPVTESQIDHLCAEAKSHAFAAVCIRPNHVVRAVQNLKDSRNVSVASVISFPEGTNPTSAKRQEAEEAVRNGAGELDMVMNYPLLKEGQYMDVYHDILAVREAAPEPCKLKVILETSQLSRDQVVAGSLVACLAGADFVKTSTGFNGSGASVENVELMRGVADLTGKGTRVKASGGVRSVDDAVKMLRAGADRIGTSSGVNIMAQLDGGETLEQGASHAVY